MTNVMILGAKPQMMLSKAVINTLIASGLAPEIHDHADDIQRAKKVRRNFIKADVLVVPKKQKNSPTQKRNKKKRGY